MLAHMTKKVSYTVSHARFILDSFTLLYIHFSVSKLFSIYDKQKFVLPLALAVLVLPTDLPPVLVLEPPVVEEVLPVPPLPPELPVFVPPVLLATVQRVSIKLPSKLTVAADALPTVLSSLLAPLVTVLPPFLLPVVRSYQFSSLLNFFVTSFYFFRISLLLVVSLILSIFSI